MPTTDPQQQKPGHDDPTREGATNEGVSAETPAEGADDESPEQPGSPKG